MPPKPKSDSEPAVTRAKYENPLLAPDAPNDEGRVELPRLHITIERIADEASETTYVHDGDVCRVGSHASNDLVLADPTVSKFHCRISREGAG